MRRVSSPLGRCPAASIASLGLLVADPEMSGDAVNHDPLCRAVMRVCLSAVSSLMASLNRSAKLERARGSLAYAFCYGHAKCRTKAAVARSLCSILRPQAEARCSPGFCCLPRPDLGRRHAPAAGSGQGPALGPKAWRRPSMK